MKKFFFFVLVFLLAACGQTETVTPPEITYDTSSRESTVNEGPRAFNGESSFAFIEAQTAMGPRYPGSPGHGEVQDYIVGTLESFGWEAERQVFDYDPTGFDLIMGMNIIGRSNIGAGPIIILGAHYDTRARSDQSPGQESTPTLGAVDGGSGVAVLLELARTLNLEEINYEIWLTFFDLEDNGSGGIPNWDWIVGSTYMAENLTDSIEMMVLVDMIGDADQQLYRERTGTSWLTDEIWAVAAELGYEQWFINEPKYSIIDDHVPFLRQNIPAIDIIDFDYEHWHKVSDTADKASPESLERVGHTIQFWLEEKLD